MTIDKGDRSSISIPRSFRTSLSTKSSSQMRAYIFQSRRFSTIHIHGGRTPTCGLWTQSEGDDSWLEESKGSATCTVVLYIDTSMGHSDVYTVWMFVCFSST
jgi:hypothetical protein